MLYLDTNASTIDAAYYTIDDSFRDVTQGDFHFLNSSRRASSFTNMYAKNASFMLYMI